MPSPLVECTRNTPAYVFDGTKYVKKQPDEKRIAYNADGSYRGLLTEMQSTNLIAHSTEAPWGAKNMYHDPIQSDVGVAPDGTNTADKIGASKESASRFESSLATQTAGKKFVLSYFYKPLVGSGPPLSFSMPINLTRLDQYEDYSGHGWKRHVIEYEYNNTGEATLRLYIELSGSDECLIWGAQNEAEFLTSPIVTHGSQVTRAEDILTIPNSEWLDFNEGAVYLDCDWEKIDEGGWGNLIGFGGTYADGIISVDKTPTGFYIAAGFAKENVRGSGTESNGKALVTWGPSYCGLYFNGVKLTESNQGVNPRSGTLQFMDAFFAKAYIRGCRFLPNQLSEAEAISMTGA